MYSLKHRVRFSWQYKSNVAQMEINVSGTLHGKLGVPKGKEAQILECTVGQAPYPRIPKL